MTERKAQTASFPGYFVGGQDTLSQAQVADYARNAGWTLRTGEDAALIATLNGREVLLPASGLRYSRAESAQLVAGLNPNPYVPPGRGHPGSDELAEVVAFYRTTRLPTVGVGHRWGPFMPQIREPAHDAPELRSLDEDMQAVAEQRWPWAQAWHPRSITAENRDEVARRGKLWRPETKSGDPATKWRPCTHLAICMWASSSRHLHGHSASFSSGRRSSRPRILARSNERFRSATPRGRPSELGPGRREPQAT